MSTRGSAASVVGTAAEEACLLDAAELFAPGNVAPARGVAMLPGKGWWISGPERSGKTTLLFQLGLNTAAAGRRAVMWIDNLKLQRQNPIPERDMAENDDEILSRLQMKYYSSNGVDGLLQWLAQLHMRSPDELPTAILVDDLLRWSDSPLQTVRALALLENVVEWMRRAGKPAYFAVTDCVDASSFHPRGLRRRVSLRCDLQRADTAAAPPTLKP
eukprot:Hpha_TRINITY_DN3100_c0_g1::TRINITY_DN3100_c0_g1_i1::g.96718::m.96718